MSWAIGRSDYVPLIAIAIVLALALVFTIWSAVRYIHVPEGRIGLYAPKGTQPNASTPILDSGTRRRQRGHVLTTYPVVSVPEGCLGLVYKHTGQTGWQHENLCAGEHPNLHPFTTTVVVIGEMEDGSTNVYGDPSIRDFFPNNLPTQIRQFRLKNVKSFLDVTTVMPRQLLTFSLVIHRIWTGSLFGKKPQG
jgi:hypothetical protein